MGVEARDASGNVEHTHVEAVTAPSWMFVLFAVIGLAAALVAVELGRIGSWAWIGAVLAALVAIVFVPSALLMIVGRYAGLPWHFTP